MAMSRKERIADDFKRIRQASEADLEKVLKAKSGREWVGEEIFRSSARHEYYHLS